MFDIWNVTYRAHLVAQFRAANPANKLVPFVLVGGGAFAVVDSQERPTSSTKDTDAALYVGVGAKYRVDNGWGLRADCAHPVPAELERATASTRRLRGAALDLQGVRPQGRREGRRAAAKAPTTPTATASSDDADKCPNEAEDKDGFQDDDGCPDPDNDGDGIADAADKCPNEPEDKDGFQDDDGCPEPDNDSDGIPDAADKCPNEAEDKDGFQDDDGCPDPDNDGDGVLDAQRQVPDRAGDQERLPGRRRLPRRDPGRS